MLHERDTIRRIRQAVADGRLAAPFRAADVNRVLKSTSPVRSCRSIALAIPETTRSCSFRSIVGCIDLNNLIDLFTRSPSP
jgi:hypothetical protein